MNERLEQLLFILEELAATGNPGAQAAVQHVRARLAQLMPSDPMFNEQAALVETRALRQDTERDMAREQEEDSNARLRMMNERHEAQNAARDIGRRSLEQMGPVHMATTGVVSPPGIMAPTQEDETDEEKRRKELQRAMERKLATRR